MPQALATPLDLVTLVQSLIHPDPAIPAQVLTRLDQVTPAVVLPSSIRRILHHPLRLIPLHRLLMEHHRRLSQHHPLVMALHLPHLVVAHPLPVADRIPPTECHLRLLALLQLMEYRHLHPLAILLPTAVDLLLPTACHLLHLSVLHLPRMESRRPLLPSVDHHTVADLLPSAVDRPPPMECRLFLSELHHPHMEPLRLPLSAVDPPQPMEFHQTPTSPHHPPLRLLRPPLTVPHLLVMVSHPVLSVVLPTLTSRPRRRPPLPPLHHHQLLLLRTAPHLLPMEFQAGHTEYRLLLTECHRVTVTIEKFETYL